MAAKYTVEDFTRRAIAAHGDTYDYSLVDYVSSHSKVQIVCRKHGPFWQEPSNHWNRVGCPHCKRATLSKLNRSTTAEFIAKATAIHGDKYGYDLVEYSTNKSKVRIICPIEGHGEFLQKPNGHLDGEGCPACGDLVTANALRSSDAQFIRAARLVHGDRYDYSQVSYAGAKDKLPIICRSPGHGMFLQTANDHLDGHGCPACSTGRYPSKSQLEILSFVESLGFTTERDAKIPGYRHEIDVYVPEKSFGIEYDGVWWHSEKYKPRLYHRNKLRLAQAQGIDLLQIFSDQWEERKDAWKAVIARRLGVPNAARVFARNCSIVAVSAADEAAFLEKHHVQGASNRRGAVGLVSGEGLVAAMSFSKAMSARGVKHDGRAWELVRYATSCTVVGGASRLLKAFLSAHPECETILSYSDPRVFTGQMYRSLGFSPAGEIEPNYTYVSTGKNRRLPKTMFIKSKMHRVTGAPCDMTKTERENANAAGYFQLFDSGLQRWVYTV